MTLNTFDHLAQRLSDRVLKRFEMEKKAPLKISIMGQTGVGKTSLINALGAQLGRDARAAIDSWAGIKDALDVGGQRVSFPLMGAGFPWVPSGIAAGGNPKDAAPRAQRRALCMLRNQGIPHRWAREKLAGALF
jgi:hypothetical protein